MEKSLLQADVDGVPGLTFHESVAAKYLLNGQPVVAKALSPCITISL